ncbi:high affinity immunoglobulin epsilon receptor subunit beta, partial [Camelus ferus]
MESSVNEEMDTGNRSRTDLALPDPHGPSSVPEIELPKASLHENVLLEKPAPSPRRQTWLTFLKKELEFLGIRGSLGANTVSSVAGGTGIVILIINLKASSAYIHSCQENDQSSFCSEASFSTEIVAMILFLTILGFCSAVSVTAYRIGEVLEQSK